MQTVELALSLLLIGCRTVSVPPGNLPFDAGAAISGCFTEQGEAAEDEKYPQFLSAWLWPDMPADTGITVVSFVPATDGTIVVHALAGGQNTVRERTIPASARSDGRVVLAGGFWFSPFWNQGSEPPPLVGPYTEHTELGLDTAGDLKVRRSGWAAGLVFLLIPFAFSSDEQYRFRRAACPLAPSR